MSNVSQCMTRQQSNMPFKYNVMCSNVKGRILTLFCHPNYVHGKETFLENPDGIISFWKTGLRSKYNIYNCWASGL